MDKFTILEIMQITGVSKRTLHYYDSINILKPQKNKENGYRIYTREDLIKLQKIMFFKQVGLTLNEIKEIINKDNAGVKLELVQHKEMLEQKINKLEETLENVKKIIAGDNVEKTIFQNNEVYDIQRQYEEEAKIKYGATEEYKNFQKNFVDGVAHEQELATIYRELYMLIDTPAESAEVQKVIAKLFTTLHKIMGCTQEVFYYICLGYVEDIRFRKYFEKFGERDLPIFILEAAKVYTNMI